MSKQNGSLLNDLRAEQRSVSGRIPMIVAIANQMGEQDRKDLLEALGDLTITAPMISRALKKRGFDIKPGSINQYRRGEIAHVIS
jgi:hypothetical protein